MYAEYLKRRKQKYSYTCMESDQLSLQSNFGQLCIYYFVQNLNKSVKGNLDYLLPHFCFYLALSCLSKSALLNELGWSGLKFILLDPKVVKLSSLEPLEVSRLSAN